METHRLAIVGSGPAGYSAAIYAARAALEPVVLTGEKSGGQLMLTTHVENYPGFPKGILGPELMVKMREQAERFGAQMVEKFVTRVDFSKRPFVVATDEKEYQAEAVVLATGAEAKLLGIPGEEEYMGRGVSTCAVCDAAFYKDKDVFVVGGGDAAMEDTLALTKFVKNVTVVHRRDSLRASKIMQKRVLEEKKDVAHVWWNARVTEVKGDGKKVTGIVVEDTETGGTKEVEADGMFVAIGHKPATQFLRGQVELDDKGYVVTRLGLHEPSVAEAQAHLGEKGMLKFPTMTSVEGVFAGGDNVDFRYRQAVTAAGYGVMAALDAEWWLEREEG